MIQSAPAQDQPENQCSTHDHQGQPKPTLCGTLLALFIQDGKRETHHHLFDVARNVVQKEGHKLLAVLSLDDRIQFQVELEMIIAKVGRLTEGVDEQVLELFLRQVEVVV